MTAIVGQPRLSREDYTKLRRLVFDGYGGEDLIYLTTAAAYEAGANEQLRRCCEWLRMDTGGNLIADAMEAALRPRALTQKQAALAALSRAQMSPSDRATVEQLLEGIDG